MTLPCNQALAPNTLTQIITSTFEGHGPCFEYTLQVPRSWGKLRRWKLQVGMIRPVRIGIPVCSAPGRAQQVQGSEPLLWLSLPPALWPTGPGHDQARRGVPSSPAVPHVPLKRPVLARLPDSSPGPANAAVVSTAVVSSQRRLSQAQALHAQARQMRRSSHSVCADSRQAGPGCVFAEAVLAAEVSDQQVNTVDPIPLERAGRAICQCRLKLGCSLPQRPINETCRSKVSLTTTVACQSGRGACCDCC